MLKVEDLSHFYGREKILDNINFELKDKSFTILTGESGSGKTTLLSIISTLLKPTKGRVIFTDISKNNSLDTIRNRYIGFIFQFHYLISHLTVLENIKIVTTRSKSDILNILDYLGIKSLAYKYPSNISGGQRQRVAIARAIINRPKYIFADEPTGNLDSKNSRLIFDILREIDATTLVVTHDKSFIQDSDNILIMRDGILC